MTKSTKPTVKYIILAVIAAVMIILPFVAGGYVMMIACMLLTVVAYRGIPFKYGAVLEALVYLYIMVLSRVFLKEKLTGKKILGNVMIVAGVIIFSLGK